MYIWVAADVDGQLGTIREKIAKICSEGNMTNSALTLPLHISLKISCEIQDSLFDESVGKISEYFSALSPFCVKAEKVEKNGNIVWIRFAENGELCRVHRDLVELFAGGYGIEPHEFDKKFIFHTTLFYGEDEKNAEAIFEILKTEGLPEGLTAKRFIIGCSESGKAGEYRVIKEIVAKNEIRDY